MASLIVVQMTMLLAAAGDEDDGDIGNEASKTFANC